MALTSMIGPSGMEELALRGIPGAVRNKYPVLCSGMSTGQISTKSWSVCVTNYIDLDVLLSIYQFFLHVGSMCSPLYLSVQTILGVAWLVQTSTKLVHVHSKLYRAGHFSCQFINSFPK